MRSSKAISKFSKKFQKIGEELLKNITISDYIKAYGYYQSEVIRYDSRKDIFVTTSYFANISTRRTMVKTLESINYKRGNKDWNETVVICFMEEVIELFTYSGDAEYVDKMKKKISIRYNVPTNRLKTQLALFINNLENNKDKFNILDYFSIYEIIMWKYRDSDKLQELIEKDQVSEYHKILLRDLNKIV